VLNFLFKIDQIFTQDCIFLVLLFKVVSLKIEKIVETVNRVFVLLNLHFELMDFLPMLVDLMLMVEFEVLDEVFE
jgi:hypothetical protein